MKGALRLFLLMGLALVQCFPVISARASPAAAPANMADSQLYRAFLDASAKTGTALQAPGISVKLAPRGLLVSPSTGKDWTWNIALDGFGRESNVATLGMANSSQANGRSELAFGSDLTEWFRTTGIGVEQGFDINSSPHGNGQLVLHMQLDTSLSGTLSKDNRSITFDAGSGQVLHYADLRAFDANGKELDANLVYAPSELTIHIDDRGAAYPLTVDPIMYMETGVASPAPTANDSFGGAVAVSGDTGVVGVAGENSGQGAAYVFQRSGLNWIEMARLTASDPTGLDYFGVAVGISGDTVVVGAGNYNAGIGSAYVFVRPAGGWSDTTETAELGMSSPLASSLFGHAVAVSGDTIVVGAPGYNSEGAAFVYVEPGSGWANANETAQLSASDIGTADEFGASVGVSDTTIVIGSPQHNSYAGAAYVFTKPGGGWTTTTQTARLTSTAAGSPALLGKSVAVSGDTIAVGANYVDSYAGAAFVYVRNGSWTTTSVADAKLTASDAGLGDMLGYSVAISGNTIAAGAPSHYAGTGAVYVFVNPGSGWVSGTEDTKVMASNGAYNDGFGYGVSLSGSTLLSGAPYRSNYTGLAYFYYPNYQDTDLAVGVLASKTTLNVGDTVSLTASVTNLGSATATAVAAKAPLPAGLAYLSSGATYDGVYDPNSGMWSVGTLKSGVTASLTIKASVEPAAGGTQPVFGIALAALDSNAANNTASLTLKVPAITISPSSLTFGSQLIGSTSSPYLVTLTDQDPDGASLGTLSATSAFILSNDSCSTADLSYMEACTFNVKFKPNATGPYTGHVSIPLVNPASTLSLPLSGTGVAGTQLLANRYFEADSNSDFVPDNWQVGGIWTSGDGTTCLVFHSGLCSFTLLGTGVTAQLTQTIVKSGVAGDDFRAAVYAQGSSVSNSTAAAMRVKILNGSTTISTQTFYMPAGTYAWTKKVLNFTAPGPYTSLQVILWYSGTSGQIWYDDASLTWAP